MKLFLRSAVFLLCFASHGLSAPIYKTPSSAYSSGDKPLKLLQKKTERIISKFWYQVDWKKGKTWLPASNVINHFHVAHKLIATRNTPVRKKPEWQLSPTREIEKGEAVHLILQDEDWGLVQLPSQKKGWVSLEHFLPSDRDYGSALTKENMIFNGLKLPAGTSLPIVNFSGEYVRVRYKRKVGLLPLLKVMTKLDFASHFQSGKKKKWSSVNFTLGPWVKTEQKNFTHFKDLHRIRTRSDLIFTIGRQSPLYPSHQISHPPIETLDSFHPLQTSQRKKVQWGLSQLSRRESYWWALSKALPPPKREETYSTQEIFSRQIFALSTSPKTPNLMFASARGIFRTLDGKNWKRVKLFKNENHPIAISPTGTIFIGAHRSYDYGKTFHPYIRWDQVTSVLQKKLTNPPKQIRIKKIAFNDDENLILSLDLGKKKTLDIVSENEGSHWETSPKY